MNFFKTLSETGIKDVVIQVKQDSTGAITVFVTPKTISEDSALKGLKPLHLTGTPEEIDAEFFGLVTTPLQQTQTVFNNVEAFEAQLREASKATADKKAEKDAAAKAKKETTTTTTEDGKEVPAPVEKVVKVNNEKALKDFMTSIKGKEIIESREKIEELYANLSPAELDKPFPKKVRIDLDIAIRKVEAIEAAREKLLGTKKEEVAPAVDATKTEVAEEPKMTEPVSDIPEFVETKATDAPGMLKEKVAEMQVVKESPNVDSVPGHVEEPSTTNLEPVVDAPPTPAPVAPVYEEVQVLEMIDKEYSYEDFIAATWTDELLVAHGKAHYITIQKEVEPVKQKLSYTFPKEFDAPEQQ